MLNILLTEVVALPRAWRSGGAEDHLPNLVRWSPHYGGVITYKFGFTQGASKKGPNAPGWGGPPPNGRSPGISMPVPHYSSWRDPKLSLLEERVYHFSKRRRLERLPLVELGMTARCKTPTSGDGRR